MPCSLIVKVRLYLNDARDSVASRTVSANGNFRQGGSLEGSRLQLIKFPELYDKWPNWPHADAGNSLWLANPSQSPPGSPTANGGLSLSSSLLQHHPQDAGTGAVSPPHPPWSSWNYEGKSELGREAHFC